jgi:type II secretory pathway pseudopilin PulG
MTTKLYSIINDRGLTILEIIVTIVVAAILGTVLVRVMSTSLTRSSVPITLLQDTYSARQIIEEMTADYEELYDKYAREYDISTLKTYIENGNVSSNTPYYGEYSLDYIDYIKFDASYDEVPDASGDDRILKVTLTSNNQSLTVLFTK